MKAQRVVPAFILGLAAGISISFLMGFTSGDRVGHNPYHPKHSFSLERSGYTLAYDGRTRGAAWVYQHLTTESLAGIANRDGVSFREDEEIPEFLRSTSKDYLGSGYDRGHLCPAGDCKRSREAMQSSFLLSNVSPQVASLNRGAWKELESQVRELAHPDKTVHVYTIPLFLPSEIEGKKEVRYPVIGANDVAVPTHFAKVAIIDGESPPLAYILPNERILESARLEQFKTTIEKVERAAGMVLPR